MPIYLTVLSCCGLVCNRREAMVWTNALTEYVNCHTGSNLEPVYYTDSNYSTPIRTADDTASMCITDALVIGQIYAPAPYLVGNTIGFRITRNFQKLSP